MDLMSTRTTEDTKKMLQQIVEFINIDDVQSVFLWDILTALRGPDNGNDTVKEHTTSRIRGAIGLKQGENGHFLVSNEPLMFFVDILNPLEGATHHFMSHYEMATTALRTVMEKKRC